MPRCKHIHVQHPRILIVGHYGSGKTEVAVNLARHIKETQNQPVTLADLDLVNPYFRSRQAKEVLKDKGISVFAPNGANFFSDLPLIVPQLTSALRTPSGFLIVDVGGDESGVVSLASLSEHLPVHAYHMWVVVNAYRPLTRDASSCALMIEKLEKVSHLRVDGIISNTHVLHDTTASDVLEGLRVAEETSRKMQIPVVFVAFPSHLLKQMKETNVQWPFLPLNLIMLRPWERQQEV